MITIELPFLTPSQNERDRWHFRKRGRFKEQCCAAVMVGLAKAGVHGIDWPERRVEVSITRYSAGELDDDNLRGGAKDLIDALVLMRVLRDDKPRWLTAHYDQRKVPRTEACTVIEIDR